MACMFVLLFCFSVGVQASSIDIEAGLYNDDLTVFFINDFDLTQSGTSPLIFWVNLTNTYPETRQVEVTLRFVFADFASGPAEFAYGVTEPFNVAPGVTSLTNQDLYSSSDQYRFKDWDIDDENAQELIDIFLATSKLPTGTYQIHVSVRDVSPVNPGQISNETIEITVQNPTELDLISPGELVSSSEIMEIYTTVPVFLWESNAPEFELKVCEKQDFDATPEGVMDSEPRLFVENLTVTSYQYPPASVFPLEEGRTYYWQVTAVVQSSSGPIRLPSEIWAFRIAETSSGATSLSYNEILSYLRYLLGNDTVDLLLADDNLLKDYLPTEEIIKDGDLIDIDEFRSFIDKVTTGDISVTGYVVE